MRVVIEPDGRLHVAVGVEPEHPKSGAIIDGGELSWIFLVSSHLQCQASPSVLYAGLE